MMGKKTIKLSYSILNAWANGHWEGAVSYYLGREIPETPAMTLGKLMHQQWEQFINTNKALPDELGGGSLREPITEQKYRKLIPFSDEYQILLSGMPDLSDGETIYEFKCGRTEASNYIDSFQLDYYKLLLPNATLGKYLCWNPYLKQLSIGVKFLTDENAERALEHIITHGGELIEYLAANKLIIDYKE